MVKVNRDTLDIINKNISVKYSVVPKEEYEDKIVFWSYKYDQNTESYLKILMKKEILFEFCELEELSNYRDKLYSVQDISSIKSIMENLEFDIDRSSLNIEDNNDSSIAKLLNLLIEYSIENNCSDIHIDSFDNYSLIRVRADGNLYNLIKLDLSIVKLLINRIKVLSNLDYTIKNIPQDGRFSYTYNKNLIDIRVATMPTKYLEKVVLRILDKSKFIFSIDNIGLNSNQIKLVNKLLRQPNGLIIVAGPTGSGKSSTIYTFLKAIQKEEINIITIENPVEYNIEGINQIEINEKVGLDFDRGLKSILRLDPDKIMVGEIRDLNTAKTAIRASITGHMVMTTLHTNDSPSTIYRLKDMGIENYLISSSVIGIISQRLVRKLCNCKKETKKYIDIYGEEMTIYEPQGCSKCRDGYIGRKAIFEILVLNDNLREKINDNISLSRFKKYCVEEGMISLKEEIKILLENGITSLEEVYKNLITLEEL